MGGRPDLSLVLACYNEGPTLVESVECILSLLEATRFSFELIFVDDASTDGTKDLIAAIIEKNRTRATMHGIFHETNLGRGGAVRDGFLAARGEIVGYLDADLEIPAPTILACLLAIRRGCDVAIGKRIYRFRLRSANRYLMSRGYAWLVRRLLRLDGLTDTESGCKFFRRDRILPLLGHVRDTRWFWDTEIMAVCYAAGLEMVEVPCLFLRRFDRPSSVRGLRDSVEYLVKLLRLAARRSELKVLARADRLKG